LIGDCIFKIDYKASQEKQTTSNMFSPIKTGSSPLRTENKFEPTAAVKPPSFDNFKAQTAQSKKATASLDRNRESASFGSLFMPLIALFFLIGIVWFYKNYSDVQREPAASKESNLIESIEGTTKEISRIEQSQKTKTQLPIQQEYARQHYQKGFRDYRLGQYDRALQSFQAALSFDSNHKLARKYWDLSKRKLDEKIQGFLVGSRDHLQRGNYKLCLSSARSVMNMIKDSTDNRYKEASQIQSYCEERIGEVQ